MSHILSYLDIKKYIYLLTYTYIYFHMHSRHTHTNIIMPPISAEEQQDHAGLIRSLWSESPDHRTVRFHNVTAEWLEVGAVHIMGVAQTAEEQVKVAPGASYDWNFLGKIVFFCII